jgi:hypothetical protein
MRRWLRGALCVAAVGALLCAWPSSAAAQKKGKPAAAAKAAKPAKPAKGVKGVKGAKAPADAPLAPGEKEPEARVERTERGGKVIKLSPIIVEGKVQKPLALVLARSSIPYEWEQLKQDFTPKIVDSVSKSPF